MQLLKSSFPTSDAEKFVGQPPRVLLGLERIVEPNRRDALIGRGCRIFHIEYDVFETHRTFENQKPLPSLKRRLLPSGDNYYDRLFEAIRETVHATAVASIITDQRYGIAPGADYHFIGGSDRSDWDSEGIAPLVRRLRKEKYSAVSPGDILCISLQIEVPLSDGTYVFLPVDYAEEAFKQINRLASECGVIVFVACGNNRLDLSQQHSILEPYNVATNNSEAIKVGCVSNDCLDIVCSNYGSKCEFFMPSSSIMAACYEYDSDNNRGDLLDTFVPGFSKSSAATPMLAATAACMQEKAQRVMRRKLTKNEIVDLLSQNSEKKVHKRTPINIIRNAAQLIESISPSLA